jgi:hypothetical protein
MEFEIGQPFRIDLNEWQLVLTQVPPEAVFAWAESISSEALRIARNIHEISLARVRAPEVDSLVVSQRGASYFALSFFNPGMWGWALFRTFVEPKSAN